MFAKITLLLSLNLAVVAEEKSLLNLKKVIRGALDVVAAVPTSSPVNYNFDNPSQVTPPNSIQGIDPIIRERLSGLFHIPPDFVHRLAAQAGFIDYEPTTAKPYPNYWLKPKPHLPQVNPEYTTGSAFIQEDPSIVSNSANDLSGIVQQQSNFSNSSQIIINHTISEQQAAILQSEQQAVIFQPVTKDGHLYYQPFGILPQGSQPKMIIYGGRLYMATPFLSETPVQQVTMGDMVAQNSSEITDKKGNDNQLSDIPNERNEEMHYHRIYEKHIKTADEQARTTKLQQVILPDASPIEIFGVESKAKTSSPYRKVYKEELENYDAPHQFNLQERLQEVNNNLAQQYIAGNDQERETINFQMTKSVTPHNRPAETTANFVGKTENSNLQSYQLSFNEDFKHYEGIDNKSIDRAIKEQTTTSAQQTDKFITGTLSREKASFSIVEEGANTEFTDAKQSMRRILALRRKMAADRKKFAERKRLLLSMKRKISRHHCYDIRSLARQFGFTDIKQYVLSNCNFIKNYYPEFKCEEAELSIDKCLKLFK